MERGSAFIKFEDVYKSFGKNKVLCGLNLEISKGESVAILGQSGTGKSVLLKHILGLMMPDSGSIFIDGQEITKLSEKRLMPIRKRFGMLFQGGALFDSMNVFENVSFSLREHTDKSHEEMKAKVEEKLKLVGLEAVDSLMPSSLSGGMKKRVALARAIVLDPEAILYDEPTTGLDPITANKINHLIKNLKEILNVTSIVVTHDIHSAFMVAGRIVFLHGGSIHFDGTSSEAEETDNPLFRNFLEGKE